MTNTEPRGMGNHNEIRQRDFSYISGVSHHHKDTGNRTSLCLGSSWCHVDSFCCTSELPKHKNETHIYVHVKNLYDTSIMYICTMYIQIWSQMVDSLMHMYQFTFNHLHDFNTVSDTVTFLCSAEQLLADYFRKATWKMISSLLKLCPSC